MQLVSLIQAFQSLATSKAAAISGKFMLKKTIQMTLIYNVLDPQYLDNVPLCLYLNQDECPIGFISLQTIGILLSEDLGENNHDNLEYLLQEITDAIVIFYEN